MNNGKSGGGTYYGHAGRRLWRKSHVALFDSLAVVTVSISVIIPQVHLAENPQINLSPTYFVEAIVIPIVLATAIFLGGKRKILWFAFMAYVWAVTEDAPVYLDSLFTWPEVTSGFQHLFLEVVFHILTLFFMTLTIREAFKLRRYRRSTAAVAQVEILLYKTAQQRTKLNFFLILSLTFISFVASYAQNLPLDSFRTISGTRWYLLDIFEHVVSITFLYAAVKVANGDNDRALESIKSN
ncbi:MAG: hypothetical protein ACREBS_11065 [Nitrososphaerales archaeon]